MAFFLFDMNCFDDIKSAAENMFGTDNVDLQCTLADRPKLVIHWDEVEVSNENDEKHTIYDVYVKITFTESAGIVGFDMTRSTLTANEMRCGYVFSHLPRQYNNVMNYLVPCLGGGPIKTTMTTLASSYNPDIFRLFLVELDRYIRTESISGGPYIRMGEVANRYSMDYIIKGIDINNIPDNYICDLFDYIMSVSPVKPLYHDKYNIYFGMTIPLVCKLTELTLDYLRHKDNYKDSDIDSYLIIGAIADGRLYISSSCNPMLDGNNMRTSIYFKGRNVEFKKIGVESNEDTYIIIPEVARGLITLLYRYYLINNKENGQ